jgi:hypothetical protein
MLKAPAFEISDFDSVWPLRRTVYGERFILSVRGPSLTTKE